VIRLIVNADDFGASPGVNQAIVRAFRDGVLTSCSLMVGEDAFPEAVRMAKEASGLGVGLHLVAVMGKSVLPSREIPSLVDPEGHFSSDPVKAGLNYFFSTKARKELAREMRAQFERFLASGLRPSHVDSHLHLHFHPVMFDLAVGFCNEFGIRCMRIPEDDPGLLARWEGKHADRQQAAARFFRLFTRRMKARLEREGIVHTRKVFGHFMTGRMTKSYVLHVLDHLSPGDYEMYFHPEDTGENIASTHSRIQRRLELEILLDSGLKERIRERDIQLIHYGQLNRVS
jgi:chitin disaccharide deacetylase